MTKREPKKVKVKRVVAYRIVMSRGDDIQIDSDELSDVLAAITSGRPAIVRSGIFNPSFYVSIVKDTKRVIEFLEETKYGDERSLARRSAGLEPLENIFQDVSLKLPSAQKRPQLGRG